MVNNIKKQIRCECVSWIQLAHDDLYWRTLVNAAMTIGFHKVLDTFDELGQDQLVKAAMTFGFLRVLETFHQFSQDQLVNAAMTFGFYNVGNFLTSSAKIGF